MRSALVVFSCLFVSQPALAQVPVLVDSTGARVGQIVDLDLRNQEPEASVAVMIDGRGGVLRALDTTVSLEGPLLVLFEGDGCTGAAYLFTDFGLTDIPLFGEYFLVAGTDGDLYAFSQPAPRVERMIESEWEPRTATCRDVSILRGTAGPLELVKPGYGAGFVPPFRFVVLPTSAAAVSAPAVGAIGLAVLVLASSWVGVWLLRRG